MLSALVGGFSQMPRPQAAAGAARPSKSFCHLQFSFFLFSGAFHPCGEARFAVGRLGSQPLRSDVMLSVSMLSVAFTNAEVIHSLQCCFDGYWCVCLDCLHDLTSADVLFSCVLHVLDSLLKNSIL